MREATNLSYCSSLPQVIDHTKKSSASWMTSLKLLIQFSIAWFSSCYWLTLRSTALMVDNQTSEGSLELRKPISWTTKDPNYVKISSTILNRICWAIFFRETEMEKGKEILKKKKKEVKRILRNIIIWSDSVVQGIDLVYKDWGVSKYILRNKQAKHIKTNKSNPVVGCLST